MRASKASEEPRVGSTGQTVHTVQHPASRPSDREVSSDDETQGNSKVEEEEVREALGVSIGREQTRLNSPVTPAVEKAAAIHQAGGFFGPVFDGATSRSAHDVADHLYNDDEQGSDVEADRETPEKVTESPEQYELPSPWRAESVLAEKPKRARSILKEGFAFGRKRASSGSEAQSEAGNKTLFASLTTAKNFSIGSAFPSSRNSVKSDGKPTANRRSLHQNPIQKETLDRQVPKSSATETVENNVSSNAHATVSTETESPKEVDEARATLGELPKDLQLQHVRPRPAPLLRRSTSDTSLVTQRTLSRVSSLGDDSRFDDVHAQVNSRVRAIKDSLQDSSIKLPSISGFNVSSFTSDFLNRDRSGTSLKKSADSSNASNDWRQRHAEKPTDPITRQPYQSAKAAVSDTPVDRFDIEHPHFTKALEQLEGDIVVLGGYRGSILRSAEPPHRQLWVPIKVGLNLRKVDLEVGIGEGDDVNAIKKVIPGGMLTHIGPVDISRRFLKRLSMCENAQSGKLRVHEYGYDWRLHPHHLSKQLLDFLAKLPCNQPGTPKKSRGAIVVAHSLGGLITRHAVNQRPEFFSGVVYAGVPKTCVNILGPLRNGDEVLLSSRVLTAQVNFTIRTSFALLPLNGRCFFDKNTKEEYRVDFFDPQTWIEYRLSPCVARPLPPLTAPVKSSTISLSSIANALPSLPLRARKGSLIRTKGSPDPSLATSIDGVEAPDTLASSDKSGVDAVARGNFNASAKGLEETGEVDAENASPRTAVTMPRDEAIEYLTRTLRTVKQFKQELAFMPEHHTSNVYPPISVIYGKSTPTVFGARVDGREAIKHADAYDDLAFASGDGVVLAKASMVPEGYRTVRGGIVSSDRGHVTLLGDLEAVGRCLNAVIRGRQQGVGLES